MQDDYTIGMEVKSETYFGRGMFFFDLAFIAGYWLFFSNFENLIHPLLTLPFHGFNILIAITLTRKSHKNPKKRNFQSLIYKVLASRSQAYHVEEREEYEEIEYIESDQTERPGKKE